MWNSKINDNLISQGFSRLDSDTSIYVRWRDDHLAILGLYVDDILLLSDTITHMNSIKDELKKAFKITDGGEINHFLGLHIVRNRHNRTLSIDQKLLTDNVINRFGMQDCHSVATPMETSFQSVIKGEMTMTNSNSNSNSNSTNEKEADQTLFKQIIGSLMYLMLGTRPDIATAISLISQFAAKPKQSHLLAAKRVLRYIKGTKDYKLYLGRLDNDNNNHSDDIKVMGYSDADWANDPITWKLISEYVFYLQGGIISKKQATVALSTTEAEYIALTQATKEAIWLRSLLGELGFNQYQPTLIKEDNQPAIQLANNPINHNRTKHIDTQYHYVRAKIETKEINVIYTPTNQMTADIFTKPLPQPAFSKCIKEMNIRN